MTQVPGMVAGIGPGLGCLSAEDEEEVAAGCRSREKMSAMEMVLLVVVADENLRNHAQDCCPP